MNSNNVLTFSDILDKHSLGKSVEEELSKDFINLCNELINRNNYPSDQMFVFMDKNLPYAKEYVILDKKLCVDYFEWLYKEDKERFSKEIENNIKIENPIPYSQIIRDALIKNNKYEDFKMLNNLFVKLYNCKFFDINKKIHLSSTWHHLQKCEYKCNNLPSYIFSLKKDYENDGEYKNGDRVKSLFDYKYGKIYETLNKRRGISLNWNCKKLLLISIYKDQEDKCYLSKVPKDLIKIIIEFCYEELEQPITNLEPIYVDSLKDI